MIKSKATKAREEFFRTHLIGSDDANATVFYQKIITQFNFEISSNKKIAFVVVAHMVHSLPPFLEALTRLGKIAAIIPKQSSCVPSVVDSIKALYRDEHIVKENITKEVLQTVCPETIALLQILFTSDKRLKDHQFIILDHGGYFAPQMTALKKCSNILGIVEHTWNGEIKYLEDHKARHESTYIPPVYSIARTPLKAFEDPEVADSIITSIKGKVLSAEGLNQTINTLNIGIVGFGHLGKAIAQLLKKENLKHPIRIVDINPETQDEAKRAGFHLVSNNMDDLAQHADLIIVATSSQSFTQGIFSKLKSRVCLICVTSSDDLFTKEALIDYKRCDTTNSFVAKYESNTDGKIIYLAANGKSVNFLIGSTAHPILHAVLSSVYVSAGRLIENNQPPQMTIQSIHEADQQRIRTIYETQYGPIKTPDEIMHEIAVEKLLSSLRFHYQTAREVVQMDLLPEQTLSPGQQPPSIEEAFIRLTIIKEKEQRNKEKEFKEEMAEHEKKRDEFANRLRSWEDLDTAKEPFDLDKIFMPGTDTASPRKLLIFGRAGIGKSTLCQYSAHQWAQGKLWPNFKVVFWISLRKLNRARYPKVHGGYHWIDLLNRECFANNLSSEEQNLLRIEIKNNPHQFLFLLDGYDELSKEAKDEDGYLQPAFHELLNQPHCLITSRPQQAFDLEVDRKLEVMGFAPKDIETYIHRFFKQLGDTDTLRANALLDFLRRQPMVWGIAHIPLQLAMICQLSAENQLIHAGENKLTLSELYHRLTHNMFKRFLIRTKQSRETTPKIILQARYSPLQKTIEQLAYDSMLSNTIIFSENDLVKAIKLSDPNADINLVEKQFKNFLACGLLRHTENDEYYFIHLTFQEYFAASFVARVLKEETFNSKIYESIVKTILCHRYNPRLQAVWWFVAGHLSFDVTSLQRFFDILLLEPRDLIGIYEQRLLLQCLVESGEPKGLDLTRDKLLRPLLTALQDRSSDVIGLQNPSSYLKKMAAMHALGNVGAAAATSEVLQQVLIASKDQDKNIVEAAINTLGNFGAAAATPEVLQQVLIALQNQERSLRCTTEVQQQMLIALQNQDRSVRWTAVNALRNFGAAAATPKVLQQLLWIALQNPDRGVREAAMNALRNFGVAAATPKVLQQLLWIALQNPDRGIREAAMNALRNFGVAAVATFDFLILILLIIAYKNQDEGVRCTAMNALRNFGAAAVTAATSEAEVCQQMLIALQNQDWGAKWIAANILRHFYATVTSEAWFYQQMLLWIALQNPEVRQQVLIDLQNQYNHNQYEDVSRIGALIDALEKTAGTDFSDLSRCFNFLPQESRGEGAEMIYSAIAMALVYCFYSHDNYNLTNHIALCYNSHTNTFSYWKKGKLQQHTFSPQSSALLIQKIRKTWVEITHLPLPALTLSAQEEPRLQQQRTIPVASVQTTTGLFATDPATNQPAPIKPSASQSSDRASQKFS